MSMDNLPAPSVATQVRQANSDPTGKCLVCRAEPDWQCDEVEHRRAGVETYALFDAYCEVLDPAKYLRQFLYERDGKLAASASSTSAWSATTSTSIASGLLG